MEPKFVATTENMPELMRQAYRFNRAVIEASSEDRVSELTDKMVDVAEAVFLGEKHADVMMSVVNFVGNFVVTQNQASNSTDLHMLACAFQLMLQDFIGYYEAASEVEAESEGES